MMLVVLYVALHLSFEHLASSSWTQQYGDPASTNYVPITSGSHIETGWTYSNNDNGFYNSPAVSDKGVVFIPFLKVPEYSLQVRAVSPEGKQLWIADWIGGDDACSIVSMTNALYDSNRDMVVVGWFCVATQKNERTGQLVALNAADGSHIWNESQLNPGNDMSSLSMNTDCIFLSVGYDCHRNVPLNTYLQPYKTLPRTQNNVNDQENKSQIIVVDLATGNMLCNMLTNHSGCTAQTKLVSLKDGSSLAVVPINLPSDHSCTGDLLSLKFSSSSAPCIFYGLNQCQFSYDSKFAFSNKGVMFGSYGFAGNPDLIFAMDVLNKKKLFSNQGYCGPNAYPSGPAVDIQGHAYYSCGNKLFAVYSNGTLRWNSKLFGEKGYRSDALFKLSPSIHLDRNVIVFVDTDSTHIYALSSKDGSLQGSANITGLTGSNGCIEPPLLVGDAVYLVKAHEGDFFHYNYLYSIQLVF